MGGGSFLVGGRSRTGPFHVSRCGVSGLACACLGCYTTTLVGNVANATLLDHYSTHDLAIIDSRLAPLVHH